MQLYFLVVCYQANSYLHMCQVMYVCFTLFVYLFLFLVYNADDQIRNKYATEITHKKHVKINDKM